MAKHCDQCLIHVEQFPLGITPVDSVRGIIFEGPIERLRMPQCAFRLCQFFPQFLVIQRPTNYQRQVSDMFLLNVLERAFSCQFYDGFASNSGRQKNKRELLEGLMKELQHLRSLAVRTGILNDDDVIALGSELLMALCQVQNTIGTDRELRFLELLHTGSDRVRVAMNEKGAKRAASVGWRALRAYTYMIRVGFALRRT